MILKYQNTRNNSAWTPWSGCVSHTGYPAHENRKGEARGRNRHKNNAREYSKKSKRKKRGTKGKSRKQGLTSANDLTIELPEERESLYHILD